MSTKVKLDEKAVVTSIKDVITFAAKSDETLGNKYDAMYKLDCRYIDMSAKTTRLSEIAWDSVRLAVKENYPAGSELRRVALLSKAEYTVERDALKGAKLKAFKKVRDDGSKRVGAVMGEMGNALLLREPASVQTKIAKAAQAAKAERKAKKVAKVAKDSPLSGKDAAAKLKIVFDTAALIVKGDEEPAGYKPSDMMKSINAALALLSQ